MDVNGSASEPEPALVSVREAAVLELMSAYKATLPEALWIAPINLLHRRNTPAALRNAAAVYCCLLQVRQANSDGRESRIGTAQVNPEDFR